MESTLHLQSIVGKFSNCKNPKDSTFFLTAQLGKIYSEMAPGEIKI